MAPETETAHQRGKRHHQRTLFDGVAQLYADSRRGYPAELVDFAVTAAGLGAGSTVLEVGCGPGQLTEHLVRYRFNVTAIDIGPAMIAAARRRLAGSAVSFQVTSFEDFAAPEASCDLVCSATAFHWVDPEVKFSKPARLLRSGGWLALLTTEESFDDPLGAELARMWAARTGDDAVRTRRRPDDAVTIAGSGLFEDPVVQTDARRMVLPAEVVIDVENTRAIVLSWPAAVRQSFTEELRGYLKSQTEVQLTQMTSLTMARVLPR